jgi:hypothetical protein
MEAREREANESESSIRIREDGKESRSSSRDRVEGERTGEVSARETGMSELEIERWPNPNHDGEKRDVDESETTTM